MHLPAQDSGTPRSVPKFMRTSEEKPKIHRSKPSSLSTQQSELKNDPLWLEYGEDDYSAASQTRGNERFAVTFEGFVPLVEELYYTLHATNKGFARRISLSAFSYYCTQLLYYRVCTIRDYQGQTASEDEIKFIDEVTSMNLSTPATLEIYLKSIGSVVDTDGARSQIIFPSFPNKSGDFGRVTAETHWKYESMPAPRVVVERIKQDLALEKEPSTNRDWDLPEELRPIGQCGLPTKNLLMWNKSVALTSEQTDLLNNHGVTSDEFTIDRDTFCFNRGLCNIISLILEATPSFKTNDLKKYGEEGSMGETLLVEVIEGQEVFNRNAMYTDPGVVVSSASRVDTRFVIGAAITKLRVRKEPINGRDCYACYDFNQYTNVPISWRRTRNRLLSLGQSENWDRDRFRSAMLHPRAFSRMWTKRSVKLKSDFYDPVDR